MKKHNSHYSNIVRPNSTRLSGLHFTETNSYWPLPNTKGVNMAQGDETLLYELVERKLGKEAIDKNRKYRPVHGIHFSLNRPDVGGSDGIPGWGAEKWEEKWREFTNSSIFKETYPFFFF